MLTTPICDWDGYVAYTVVFYRRYSLVTVRSYGTITDDYLRFRPLDLQLSKTSQSAGRIRIWRA